MFFSFVFVKREYFSSTNLSIRKKLDTQNSEFKYRRSLWKNPKLHVPLCHIFRKLCSVSLDILRVSYCHTCSQPRKHLRTNLIQQDQHGNLGTISKNMQQWGIFSGVADQQKWLVRKVTKDLRATSEERQSSLASIKVSGHDSTTRKRQRWPVWRSSNTKKIHP